MPVASPKRILAIQLRRLGDVILTTPALAALKHRYPAAVLDFLVETPGAEAVHGHPAIDNILVYRAKNVLETLFWIRLIRSRHYDWVIDFLANPRTALIAACSGAALRAGPAHVRRRWAYNHWMSQSPTTVYAGLEKIRWLKGLGVSESSVPFLPELFLTHDRTAPENAVAFAPASRQTTRRWPPSSYAALGRSLHLKYGCEIRIFWGPGERALAENIAQQIGSGSKVVCETRSIGDLARKLAACRLLVTNCSGTKHVAVGIGVPTLTIHGSSDPAAWNPPHPAHQFVRLEALHCIGCRSNICAYNLECMSDLSAEYVLPHVERLFSRTEAAA